MTLSLMSCNELDALPADLGALTRLRCLDLRDTKITVMPESCIINLCNLEMVDLGWECELPREIKNWPKLRRFTHHGDIMPRGVEKLTCLETLKSYAVREEADATHSGMQELAMLNSLQVLRIAKLENVKGGIEDAQRAKLQDKLHLRELQLNWSYNKGNADDDMVLEGLQPHSNLRLLEIDGFSGLNFPKWMSSSSMLRNLVSLYLWDCNSCENLPALGMLPSLRDLRIRSLKSVKCFGTEFYYQQQQEEGNSGTQKSTTATSTLFPSLVWLRISDMVNLEEWLPTPSYFHVDSFPLLEMLHIRSCRKLRSAPNSFPSLKDMQLERTNGNAVNSMLSASGGGCLASLTSIYICESPELTYFPLGALLPNNTLNLQSLTIKNCRHFRGFRDDELNNNKNCLHKLVLWWCPVLTSLPDLRLWTSLRELTIFKCEILKESIPYDLKSSLYSIESLKVDFIQTEDEQLEDPDDFGSNLINLLEK